MFSRKFFRARLLLNVKETFVTHLSEFVVETLTVNMVRFTLDMELSRKQLIIMSKNLK